MLRIAMLRYTVASPGAALLNIAALCLRFALRYCARLCLSIAWPS
jgi:hypothetical protein